MSNNLPNIKKARSRIGSSKIIRHIFNLDNNFTSIGKNKSFFVRTYGCQSNIRDSEIIRGILTKMGYKESLDINNADLVILNTCAIRENAEKKVFGEIGLLKKNKSNKNFIFGICGCMAQEESVVKRIIKSYPYVSFIVGTHNLYELPYVIDEYLKTKTQVIKVYSKTGDIVEDLPEVRDSKIKAWVNIMYGCDKFCSYCIVPYTRGKLRSRTKKDIFKEIDSLIKQGYKEITLLGQNVNSYGQDRKDNYKFINLLEDVCKTKIERVRFTTSNPWNFNKKIANLCVKYKNLMPYFHLPIQSGNEKILEKMNRKMKIKDYISLIQYIRKTIPLCSISTDIIVGFPNETKKQFNDTIALYKKIQYDNAYTFIYSKREGTPAASLADTITMDEKDERLTILNDLVRKYAKINCEKYIGKTLDVLVEGKSKTNDNVWTGYSPQWKVVNFNGKCKLGDIIKVKITSASRFSLNGNVVE
ncbi:MAG: tRNA (N6-isopentenyl adenosine(37)-C2)-methylthiotransferase MiaB [Mycoplasmoidaceae bacterium]|nr:MAG: tRNA (N6-isopentenyl adenosine(37)-C2)-methylthiotransferase MiaB [Mycoplasmoidaceae bacterium]